MSTLYRGYSRAIAAAYPEVSFTRWKGEPAPKKTLMKMKLLL